MRRESLRIGALSVVATLTVVDAACSRPTRTTGDAVGGPRVPIGTLALGERITAPLVPLADIAKNPARYQSGVVATSGRVTAVCKERGCWMQLEDASGQARVRMHGHTFFVPTTAPGHVARVQARIIPAQPGTDECDETTSSGAKASVELDATGVEID